MKINEIFHTIQGEGPKTGIPSIFLRLSGCNLRCTFCDTKYTWLFSVKTLQSMTNHLPVEARVELGQTVFDKSDEITNMSISEVIGELQEFDIENVVITGGEPLLQKDELEKLLSHKLFETKTIEIETNGTISPLGIKNRRISYNVSPKLRNSHNPINRRLKRDVLKLFVNHNSIFKFVVSREEELNEVNTIITELEIPKNRVYLMPKAGNKSELDQNSPYVFEACLKYGYSYSHRVHIQIFGEKRGI